MTLQKFILGIDFTENLGDVNISRPEKVQINDTENIFHTKNIEKGDRGHTAEKCLLNVSSVRVKSSGSKNECHMNYSTRFLIYRYKWLIHVE